MPLECPWDGHVLNVENTKPTVCHHVGSSTVALWVWYQVESRIWKALRHLLITPRNLQENHSHWWAVHNCNIGRSWKLQQVNFIEKYRSSIGAASYRALGSRVNFSGSQLSRIYTINRCTSWILMVSLWVYGQCFEKNEDWGSEAGKVSATSQVWAPRNHANFTSRRLETARVKRKDGSGFFRFYILGRTCWENVGMFQIFTFPIISVKCYASQPSTQIHS